MTRSYTERLLARPAPAPSRFRFTARRCRRRCARALAAGRSLDAVARVERVAAIELEALLADGQFQALVAHYAALAALPRPERLARLADVALEVLEHAVEAGELRASMFVLHEHRAGRDPSLTLAEAALARIEADGARTAPRPHPPQAAQSVTGAGEDSASCSAAPQAARSAVGEGKNRDAAWTHCATAHAHVMDAELCAVRDLQGVAAGLRRTLADLALRLASEAERAGTGLADSQDLADEMLARGVARAGHGRARAVDALIRLDRRQRAAGFGRPELDPPDGDMPAPDGPDPVPDPTAARPDRDRAPRTDPPDTPGPAIAMADDDTAPCPSMRGACADEPPSARGADDPPRAGQRPIDEGGTAGQAASDGQAPGGPGANPAPSSAPPHAARRAVGQGRERGRPPENPASSSAPPQAARSAVGEGRERGRPGENPASSSAKRGRPGEDSAFLDFLLEAHERLTRGRTGRGRPPPDG
ncbi:hypothetical protein [Marinivivus vitaminiproducens]|uniref:hypothetical protein n=1 Tax=Marinivivus vitaminiproducens TaxID=3035935 RepID=UPI0027A14D02|nr:hypothetical protein P4R82_18360 [Geminicoccaceae bacterium SCSIO 64248]